MGVDKATGINESEEKFEGRVLRRRFWKTYITRSGTEKYKQLNSKLMKKIREKYQVDFAFKRQIKRLETEITRMVRHANNLEKAVQEDIVERELSKTLEEVITWGTKEKRKDIGQVLTARAQGGKEKIDQREGYRTDTIRKEALLVFQTMHDQTVALTKMANHQEVLTSEMKIHLLSPADGKVLKAVGSVLKSGKRLLVVQSNIYSVSDKNEKLVATMPSAGDSK
jgi:ribosomal protein L30E